MDLNVIETDLGAVKVRLKIEGIGILLEADNEDHAMNGDHLALILEVRPVFLQALNPKDSTGTSLDDNKQRFQRNCLFSLHNLAALLSPLTKTPKFGENFKQFPSYPPSIFKVSTGEFLDFYIIRNFNFYINIVNVYYIAISDRGKYRFSMERPRNCSNTDI
jgi:hypothetical protein